MNKHLQSWAFLVRINMWKVLVIICKVFCYWESFLLLRKYFGIKKGREVERWQKAFWYWPMSQLEHLCISASAFTYDLNSFFLQSLVDFFVFRICVVFFFFLTLDLWLVGINKYIVSCPTRWSLYLPLALYIDHLVGGGCKLFGSLLRTGLVDLDHFFCKM